MAGRYCSVEPIDPTIIASLTDRIVVTPDLMDLLAPLVGMLVRTREALGVSLVGAVFVRLTATWLFAMVLGLGLVGVWMGSTTDWMVRSLVLVSMLRRRRAPVAGP